VEHVVQFDATRRTLPGLEMQETGVEISFSRKRLLYRCCMAVVSSCREMLG